ncbi:MAG: hypothetical protein KDJ48_05250 [Nitratireductor sp.]|nr:hypothetical protein [Nitratireductor sp.]
MRENDSELGIALSRILAEKNNLGETSSNRKSFHTENTQDYGVALLAFSLIVAAIGAIAGALDFGVWTVLFFVPAIVVFIVQARKRRQLGRNIQRQYEEFQSAKAAKGGSRNEQ